MKLISLKKLFFGLILLAILVLAGCRTAPVMNINDAPVSVISNSYTTNDVGKAIIGAGAGLGWQMKQVAPGKIVGTLHLRSHMAQVEIPYSKKSYDIIYKNSTNLKYDGSNIHSNYNGWVQRLDQGIQARLAGL